MKSISKDQQMHKCRRPDGRDGYILKESFAARGLSPGAEKGRGIRTPPMQGRRVFGRFRSHVGCHFG